MEEERRAGAKQKMLSRQKKFRQEFFSVQKEQEWLNQRGGEGYMLLEKRDSTYIFELFEGERFCYLIEWLDCAPDSDAGMACVEAHEARGERMVFSAKCWAYFMKRGEQPQTDAAAAQRNAGHYGNIAYFWYILTAVGAALCAYNFYYCSFFAREGIAGSPISLLSVASSAEGFFNAVLVFGRRIVNGCVRVLNWYFDLWQPLLGTTPAAKVLAFALPLTAAAAVVATLYYRENCRLKKLYRQIAAAEADAEGAACTDAGQQV